MRKSTHSPEYAALRERLAGLRREAGFTQRDLGQSLGVPHSWVAKVESGERRIDLVEFGWVCLACGASPSDEAAALLAQVAGPRRRPPARRGGRR
ncbi:MAG: helix-turn-helix domain-containing protein [Phycisphaerae bacterium]